MDSYRWRAHTLPTLFMTLRTYLQAYKQKTEIYAAHYRPRLIESVSYCEFAD